VSGSQSEYDHLLSFFKHLVTLATAFIGFLVAVTSVLYFSSRKDIREDAKQEATRVATLEAKARVIEQFDEKNINAMILSAAQQKVGTVTDKLIEQQLTSKLQPIQQRIIVIGQISESETRMRLGFRSGLEDLNRLIRATNDPDIIRFGKSTLATTAEHFDVRLQEMKKQSGQSGLPYLQLMFARQGRPQSSIPSSLHDVVQMINHDANLDSVAAAFEAFRGMTGENVKMFDFGAIASWCSQNQAKC
jgi:hypothetical protein